MRTNVNRHAALVAVAVRYGLVAAAVAAPNLVFAQTASELTRPASSIEIGPGAVTDGSFKAGEYNGLQKKGAFFMGAFDLRRGGAYDSDSAMRYRLKADDLGLETRGIFAEAGEQGRFRFTFAYDGIRRNRSDSYQTPYLGAGTNMLALPGTWLVPNVAGSTSSNNATTSASARGLSTSIGTAPYLDIKTTSPTAGTLLTPSALLRATVEAAANADVPLFRNFDIFTTRKRFDAGFSANLSERWGVDAQFRPEYKTGTKPMGTVSRQVGGDIAAIIADPVDTRTDQVNLALNYNNARTFVRAGFYGSYFKNNIRSVSWENWASSAHSLNTMGSAPDNAYGQFNATAGFNISRTTKLVAFGSYARNTQNDTFLTDATTPVVPVTSLDGLVVTTAFNAKLTARPAKKVNVVAAYKFDDRDNQTAINIFQYSDAGEPLSPNTSFPAGPNNPLGASFANNMNANRPYSKKINQLNASADYSLTSRQRITGAYEYQRINRQCPGSWIACADAALTNENSARAEWRAEAGAGVTVRVSYEYAARRSDYNEDAFLALVPYANVVPAGQTMTALAALRKYNLNGYGPVLGYNNGVFVDNTFFPSNNVLANNLYGNRNRISELLGMRRFFVADRNRNRLRSVLTWDASDRFTVQTAVNYDNDDYPGSTYGLQHSRTWAADLDGSYAIASRVSADVYYTFERLATDSAGNSYSANNNTSAVNGFTGLSGNGCDGFTTLLQRNNNNKVDPCNNWFNAMTDRVHTVGVGLQGTSGKLNLSADLSVSRAHGDNEITGGNWANNLLALPGAPANTPAASFISAAALPTVTTNTAELRLNARYAITKLHAVRVAYSHLHMNSADWVYEGMQIGLGTPSGVLPTNERAFKYSVNVFAVAYVLGF